MKNSTKMVFIGIVLSLLMTGMNLVAVGATDCYARLGSIANANVTVNQPWSLLVPVQVNMPRGTNCDLAYDLKFIQGPAGMTFDGNRLYWTPNSSQIGQTFPVTVRLTVTYMEPYKVEVLSKTFYLTVVECPVSHVEVECSIQPSSGRLIAQVFVRNSSSCNVTTSGTVSLKTSGTNVWANMGQWNLVAMGPNSRVLVWGKELPIGPTYQLAGDMTYSSYTFDPLSHCGCQYPLY